MRHPLRLSRVLAVALIAACGAPERERAPAGPPKVIVVRLVTDDKGNYFEPSQITARRGDVLRFTLASGGGMHNVDFFAQGPNPAGLPRASAMLQSPGQTLDVPVTFPPGRYNFQCDPHAALGMVGTLEVK